MMGNKVIMILLLLAATFGNAVAQRVEATEKPLSEVLQQLQERTAYHFYWLPEEIKNSKVSIHADCKDMDAFLKKLLEKTGLEYSIINNQYIYILKGRQLVTLIPFFASRHTSPREENETSELLQGENKKADSENKLYVVGNSENTLAGKQPELRGVITSFKTGEPVMGVNIIIRDPTWAATVSDINGEYVLKVPRGKVNIELSGMGIIDTHRRVMVYDNGRLDIELEDKMYALDEVTVTAGRIENVKNVQMGAQKLMLEDMKTIPTAFGETDILKIVQTLPGVKTMGEASSGLNVRGGATDQNLILFNEGTIYNPTHLFGFFSAFNGNIMEDMELYKSSIPAKYGGRISSVLDINSRKGSKKEYKGELNLGLLTSSICLEGPIKKDRTSLLLSGRTTYSDWILGVLPEKSGYKDGKAGFYDVNAVLSHRFSQHDNLYISGYYSHDRFSFIESEEYDYSNANASAQWIHLINENFRFTMTGGYDHYDYATESYENGNDAYKMSFNINQYFLKADFHHAGIPGHVQNWGFNGLLYNISPGKIVPRGESSLQTAKILQTEKALEAAVYMNEEWEVNNKLTISAGIRYSLFSAFGPRTYRTYRDGELPSTGNVLDTVRINGGKNLKTYQGPEFRASLRYSFTDDLSIKASFNTMRQYIHKVSNTMVMSPTDTWKLSDMYIKPQTGQQYSIGLYKNFMNGEIETSIEGYYKSLNNYLDYRSGAKLLMNSNLETEVLPTKGRAYGVELLVKKMAGKLNGWFSYTYSRTQLRQSDIRITSPVNDGEWYPAEYDKPHEIKLVANYQFTKRYSVSVNTDYSTGRPQTMPVSKYYDHTIGAPSFFYTNRNEVRIPDYFRMDLSFNIKPGYKLTALTHSSFTIGVYNLLGRKNVYSIYFMNEGEEGIKGYRMSIFGAPIPFVTYNIKF